jgi:hypothetical protein
MTISPSAIRSSIPALSLVCLAFASLAAFTGCQGPPEDDTTDSESTEESLIRPGGPECGNTVCARDKVCCNASCGICTSPGGFCTQQYCGPTPDEDGFSAGPCDTDADCRAVPNYCEDNCSCRPISATAKNPACKPSVLCFSNPCLSRRAYCDQGTCLLGSIGSRSSPPPVR